jgi:hypothetical protein
VVAQTNHSYISFCVHTLNVCLARVPFN